VSALDTLLDNAIAKDVLRGVAHWQAPGGAAG